jgi:hypothetical protein
MKTLHWIVLALIPAALAGCAGVPPFPGTASPTDPQAVPQTEQHRARAPNLNLSGFSPAFRDGYGDGCDSARERSVRRNESRYKTDLDYVMGWNDGYSVCRR